MSFKVSKQRPRIHGLNFIISDSAASDMAELVRKFKIGLVFHSGDHEDLSRQIIKILDPGVSFSSHRRKEAADMFSLKKTAVKCLIRMKLKIMNIAQS